MMKRKMPSVGLEGHWSAEKFSDNILQDALIRHALGLTYLQMADVGEVFEVITKVKSGKDWIDAWSEIALTLQKRAERSNNNVTKESAYLRASTYWRIALMYFNSIDDDRLSKYSQNSLDCYHNYLKLSNLNGEYIEIPYGDSYLPAHYYKSPVATENAPLMILTPGRDTFAEDTAWIYRQALKRGINCLVYDGPGQGFALRMNKIPFRYDIENVIIPIIDYCLKNFDGIDENNIILFGISFGGFLVPRAAIYDKRVKMCIVDPGNINWGNNFAQRLEMIQKIPKEVRPPQLNFMLEDYIYKHGATEKTVCDELRKFDNSDIIKDLDCLTIVMDGTSEMTQGESKKFYDMLECEKEYLLFDEDSGSQMHAQMGGYATASEMLFDLIEKHL
ncbi:S9 family peptidase [uncultured Methanobrevibacter sp.]|uniref:alpha/beta hydrolase family protein n=1 Tax=uncultured Methanobrevibacter sp. TaxID=253161 RepID=UPI0026DF2A5D|nr:alpha/beta fold hydrolase [uncultured Methanobrevibacter sp.]